MQQSDEGFWSLLRRKVISTRHAPLSWPSCDEAAAGVTEKWMNKHVRAKHIHLIRCTNLMMCWHIHNEHKGQQMKSRNSQIHQDLEGEHLHCKKTKLCICCTFRKTEDHRDTETKPWNKVMQGLQKILGEDHQCKGRSRLLTTLSNLSIYNASPTFSNLLPGTMMLLIHSMIMVTMVLRTMTECAEWWKSQIHVSDINKTMDYMYMHVIHHTCTKFCNFVHGKN